MSGRKKYKNRIIFTQSTKQKKNEKWIGFVKFRVQCDFFKIIFWMQSINSVNSAGKFWNENYI